MNGSAPQRAGPATGTSTGRGRPRRRLLFVGLLVLLAWGVVEVLGFVGWWLQTGACFTFDRAAAVRAEARADLPAADRAAEDAVRAADPQRAVHAGSVVHPYLGFVDDRALGHVAGYPISPFGFLDERSPVRARDPATFIVGLVGGSVALQLGLYAEPELAAALQRSPSTAGRRVEFVRLCLGGYKQPQQLLAVSMVLALGGHFDLVINLDGFNEVALVGENVPLGVPAWFPRGWARLLDTVPNGAQLRRLGQLAVLREQRAARIDVAESLWWSPLCQFAWRALDRSLQAQIGALVVAAERAPAGDGFAVRGPGTGGATVATAQAEMAALWRRSSIALHGLCKAHGIPYVHCLQPNQYVPGSKPIGAAEAAVAFAPSDDGPRAAVVAGYPLLLQEAPALRTAGVPFHDLTGIFRDHPEPVYADNCCHFDRTGNQLLAEHVAAAARRTLDGEPGAIARLEVQPAVLAWTSPLQAQRLVVLAIGADGRAFDVSGEGDGTRIASEPAGAVVVAADGSLRATHRGSGELLVQCRGALVRVPFTASWADLVDGGDARPGADGEQLQLSADWHDGKLMLRHTGTGPGLRVLALANEPLPAGDRPPERLLGLSLLPLAGADDALVVPVPAAGTLFARAYLVAAATGAVTAASNSWVLTRP